jgi:hypothetical protein
MSGAIRRTWRVDVLVRGDWYSGGPQQSAPAADRGELGWAEAAPRSALVRPDREPLADRREEPADPTARLGARNTTTATAAPHPVPSDQQDEAGG